VSVCHCRECQRRTGSAFGLTARYPREKVRLSGVPREFSRTGDEGTTATFRFCPTCGTTLWWENDNMPGIIAIAAGAFADAGFPAPMRSVYEERKLHWLDMPEGIEKFR
jgi:hypothetical protein